MFFLADRVVLFMIPKKASLGDGAPSSKWYYKGEVVKARKNFTIT